MKNLLLIFLFPLLCGAATITGYLIDQTGAPLVGTITIRPLSSPSIVGTNYLVGSQIIVTLTNGGWTNSLLQGDYQLLIAGSTSPRISVPGDTSTNNFIDLINTNGMMYVFKQPGAVVRVSTNDAVFGFLQEKLSYTSPITLNKTSSGGSELLTIALAAAWHTNTVVSLVETNGLGAVTNIVSTNLVYLGQ